VIHDHLDGKAAESMADVMLIPDITHPSGFKLIAESITDRSRSRAARGATFQFFTVRFTSVL